MSKSNLPYVLFVQVEDKLALLSSAFAAELKRYKQGFLLDSGVYIQLPNPAYKFFKLGRIYINFVTEEPEMRSALIFALLFFFFLTNWTLVMLPPGEREIYASCGHFPTFTGLSHVGNGRFTIDGIENIPFEFGSDVLLSEQSHLVQRYMDHISRDYPGFNIILEGQRGPNERPRTMAL